VMGANEHRSPESLRSYIVGTYDKDAGSDNQRLYLNGSRGLAGACWHRSLGILRDLR
jgi:hypothetical protein